MNWKLYVFGKDFKVVCEMFFNLDIYRIIWIISLFIFNL